MHARLATAVLFCCCALGLPACTPKDDGGVGGADAGPPCRSRGWDCAPNAVCTPDGEDFVCTCPAGWDGDGWTCLPPLDPCARGNGGCDPHARCTARTDGGRDCACEGLWEGDGLVCRLRDVEWARWPVRDVPTFRKDGEVAVDLTTGLEWERVTYDTVFPYETAVRRCDELALGGHDDWRLPSRAELLSLLDMTRACPTIDTGVFEGMRVEPVIQSEGWWTSTPVVGEPLLRWAVRFDEAVPALGCTTPACSGPLTLFVRCVR